MAKRRNRQDEYRRLSTWVQRVILGLQAPGTDPDARTPARSAAERGAESARNLAFSSQEDEPSALRESRGEEARALRMVGESLDEFADTTESRAAIIAAADALGDASPDFANPPLNAVWAEAGRARDLADPPGRRMSFEARYIDVEHRSEQGSVVTAVWCALNGRLRRFTVDNVRDAQAVGHRFYVRDSRRAEHDVQAFEQTLLSTGTGTEKNVLCELPLWDSA